MSNDTEAVKGEVQPPEDGEGEEKRFALVAAGGGLLRNAFVENAGLKFLAFVLALTVFILVHSDENEVYHPWVRVTYNQDSGRVLVSERVDAVQISVRGSRRRIKRLQKHRLDNIRVDLDRLSTGNLHLEPELFDLPDGVELISVNPPNIFLEFDERMEKRVPVKVDTAGLPARGFRLGKHDVIPMQVTIGGAAKLLVGINQVSTTEINVSGRTESFVGQVDIVEENFEVVGEHKVTVNVRIIEELQDRRLDGFVVSIRPGAGVDEDVIQNYVLKPEEVSVIMYGTINTLEAIKASDLQVYVELTNQDLMGGGPRKAELHVEPMLSDVGYKITPAEVTLSPR